MPVDVIPPSFARTSRTVAGFTGTNWTTGKDTAGVTIQYSQIVIQAEANGTLVEGDLVQWVAPTSTTPLRVGKADEAAGNGVLFAGAVLKGGAAGEPVTVAQDVAYVRTSGAVTAGDYVSVTTGTNAGTGVSAAYAARNAASATIGQAIAGSIADFDGSGTYRTLVAFV